MTIVFSKTSSSPQVKNTLSWVGVGVGVGGGGGGGGGGGDATRTGIVLPYIKFLSMQVLQRNRMLVHEVAQRKTSLGDKIPSLM